MASTRHHPIPIPWVRESPLTRLLLHDGSCNGKQRFHKMDIWHGFHLGIGKSWAAAGLLMIQETLDESQMDDRFKTLTSMYVRFCKVKKVSKIISKIDRHMCGGGGNNEPLGTWSKAAVTTNLCLFLEFFFMENPHVPQQSQELYYMETCWHVNICIYKFFFVWLISC